MTTLVHLVIHLGSTAPIDIISSQLPGNHNIQVAQMIFWVAFIMWAALILVIYLTMEAFECKEGQFSAVVPCSRRWVEYMEWILRFGLVCAVSLKLWRPESFEVMLVAVGIVCTGLFTWLAVVRWGFGAKVERGCFMILPLGVLCFLVACVSWDKDVLAQWGLLTVMLVGYIIPVAGCTAYRFGKGIV